MTTVCEYGGCGRTPHHLPTTSYYLRRYFVTLLEHATVVPEVFMYPFAERRNEKVRNGYFLQYLPYLDGNLNIIKSKSRGRNNSERLQYLQLPP